MNAQILAVDWLGIAETHMDTTKSHVRELVRSTLTSSGGFQYTNCIFSASSVTYGSDYKPGGVLQFAVNNLATRTVEKYSDPMGRFTSQSFIGKNGKVLSAIAAYRVVEGTHGPASASAQQRLQLTLQGQTISPRKAFLEDIIAYIHKLQEKGHEILLCLDANESMHRHNAGIRRLASMCGLQDVHQILFPDNELSSFKHGSSKIDFCLATPTIIQHVVRAGILPFDEVFMTDHRTMYVDLDIHSFFSSVNHDPTGPGSRSFTTRNKKRTSLFVQSVMHEWERRGLHDQIQALARRSRLPPEQRHAGKILKSWEKLDNEIGIIIRQAENELYVPSKKPMWSPMLMLAAQTKRYWKRRWQKALYNDSKDPSLVALSKRFQIRDDWSFHIPTLLNRYDEATKALVNILKQDATHRTSFFASRIEELEGRRDAESIKEAQALRALKKTEEQVQTFKKIRHSLKPKGSSGLSRVDIPKDMAERLNTLQHSGKGQLSSEDDQLTEIIQRTIRVKRKDSPEEWVTIIDKNQMEQALLSYCNQHFQQAKDTPFGTGLLSQLLGSSGLSHTCNDILSGTLFDVKDTSVFPELSAFLTELAIPEEYKKAETISHEIPVEEYRKRLRKWKEATSTSPSGRHLGIYRALLASEQITGDMCAMLNIVTCTGIIPKRWCSAVSVMLEKDDGAPNINRLRVIHLFEADYNLFLKVMWAQRMVTRGKSLGAFGIATRITSFS